MAVFRRRLFPIAPEQQDLIDGHRTGAPVRDFAAIYDSHFPAIFGYCLRQLGDHQAAEDAASQTFLKALRAFPTYQENGHIRAWLFAINRHVLIDLFRGQHPDEPLDRASDVPDTDASPEDRAIALLDSAWLESALTRLPPDDRQILDLRRAGLTGREIALALGISHEAAKKRQLRAVARLRAELLGNDHYEAVPHEA